MTLKTYKKAMCASAILAAVAMSGGAFAAGAAGDSYNFESGTFDLMTGLSGNGSIADVTHSATSRPMPAAGDTKVLEIAGTVVYTNATDFVNSANASQVDFLFKVEPTDELEEITDGSVQVALAVGTNDVGSTTAPIKLWSKETSAGAAGWQTILASATTGSWIRATLVMDYDAGTCKVSFNNDFAATKYLANTPSQNYVKSITMVGSTQVDELVITNASLAAYNPYKDAEGNDITVPAAGGTVAVTAKYLNDYGIKETEVDTVKNETSGMTVAEKFVAGLDPNSDTKFELKTMTTTKEAVTVTFPGMHAAGSYSVKVSTTKGGTPVASADSTHTSSEGEGQNSATVDIPSANQDQLLYITVETK